MAAYLLRRLGFIVLTLLLASIVIFAATQLLPGDVAQVLLGQFATPTALANLRAELGLDRPAYVQYFDWLGRFVSGDWGDSLASRQPVLPLVLGRMRNSAMLASLALLFYVPVGILLGVHRGAQPGEAPGPGHLGPFHGLRRAARVRERAAADQRLRHRVEYPAGQFLDRAELGLSRRPSASSCCRRSPSA